MWQLLLSALKHGVPYGLAAKSVLSTHSLGVRMELLEEENRRLRLALRYQTRVIEAQETYINRLALLGGFSLLIVLFLVVLFGASSLVTDHVLGRKMERIEVGQLLFFQEMRALMFLKQEATGPSSTNKAFTAIMVRTTSCFKHMDF